MSTEYGNKSLAQLAKEAIEVQDACNLSGVVHSFSRTIGRLRQILENQPDFSTEKLNSHPICILWASKISSLTGLGGGFCNRFGDAYTECRKIISDWDKS